jgi:hypothetical protein
MGFLVIFFILYFLGLIVPSWRRRRRRVAGLVAAVLGSHKTADHRYQRRHCPANYHHIGLR